MLLSGVRMKNIFKLRVVVHKREREREVEGLLTRIHLYKYSTYYLLNCTAAKLISIHGKLQHSENDKCRANPSKHMPPLVT